MEDTGAALALPAGVPVRLEALMGEEQQSQSDEEEAGDEEGRFLAEQYQQTVVGRPFFSHLLTCNAIRAVGSAGEEPVALGGFGGFDGSMDGGSIAAPLSPPALRSLSDADGGVPPDEAGGVNLVTDEQRAAMLLLRDPVYRECAARLENLRAVHHREKEALSKATVAGPAPSPTGVLREDIQGRRLQAQRLKRLEMLGSQLELALQNQRRYVLGRAGIAHLADGMVHLQGLGRLNESSAWIPPGGAAMLDSPHRDSSLATTGTGFAPAVLPAGVSQLAQHGSSHMPPPTQSPHLAGAAAVHSGGRRLDFMGAEDARDMKGVQSTVPHTKEVGAQRQREPQPLLQEEQMLPEHDANSAGGEQDSLSEHSPTASEIEASQEASSGARMAYKPQRLDPDDGSAAGNYGTRGAMATAERDAMSAQLLDQLQLMEAQHLDSAECDLALLICLNSIHNIREQSDFAKYSSQVFGSAAWRNAANPTKATGARDQLPLHAQSISYSLRSFLRLQSMCRAAYQ
eukprot:COSAG02_NODE_5942_length_3926_cov_2.792004_3_plen_515_part_00